MTRKQYSAEERIWIVPAGLRGEDSIAELCRREGIPTILHYRWNKDLLETGKKRLMGDTADIEHDEGPLGVLRNENLPTFSRSRLRDHLVSIAWKAAFC